jgi:hypothetical protein
MIRQSFRGLGGSPRKHLQHGGRREVTRRATEKECWRFLRDPIDAPRKTDASSLWSSVHPAFSSVLKMLACDRSGDGDDQISQVTPFGCHIYRAFDVITGEAYAGERRGRRSCLCLCKEKVCVQKKAWIPASAGMAGLPRGRRFARVQAVPTMTGWVAARLIGVPVRVATGGVPTSIRCPSPCHPAASAPRLSP